MTDPLLVADPPRRPGNSMVETLQSLIVAFVLAMTFRGFVTEGFVIPTGSMAPTLYGRHVDAETDATGWAFAMGVDEKLSGMVRFRQLQNSADPMLGPRHPGSVLGAGGGDGDDAISPVRMGDRILVLKNLFFVSDPRRFDVVVFKNPTDPNGQAGNYIKRLIGLPDEAVWLADGDVFTTTAAQGEAGELDAFRIQRKPEHVQRAVWQPVHRSDYILIGSPPRPEQVINQGIPWDGDGWETSGRTYHCERAERSVLEWDPHVLEIKDWGPYNMLTPRLRGSVSSNWMDLEVSNVSDLRVATTVVPALSGLELTFRLTARGHEFEYRLADGTANILWRPVGGDAWSEAGAVPVDAFDAGAPTELEFWHVDQALWLFVGGKRVVYAELDWNAPQRLRFSAGADADQNVRSIIVRRKSLPPRLAFVTEGSPLTMARVEVDRDLHYRVGKLESSARRNPTVSPYRRIVMAGKWAYGTHPDNLAVLGPDHFFMLGDNSAASSDSRMWGNPHPLVAAQVDAHPFLVHRSLMLGKAWVVYFPAPRGLTADGRAFVPDFGRLRFIR